LKERSGAGSGSGKIITDPVFREAQKLADPTEITIRKIAFSQVNFPLS
jgi:hypothetical protein